ncbi:C39 family peptidase [Saxibacter everestensis]|uniref:C39 family peptidase n=1 Tax=Saxibacter everestensis TaxID=2909229 RepID=A0ABY8QX56_9MICO|nr:C39 family peptidase [Brevibacteriaceae bacterium ZFBP1038]
MIRVQRFTGPFEFSDVGVLRYRDPYGDAVDREYECVRWTSEELLPGEFDQVIPSWAAETPPGCWIQVELRVAGHGSAAWSHRPGEQWFVTARWTAGNDFPADIHRCTVRGQHNVFGRVDADTFLASVDNSPLAALQLRVSLLRPAGSADVARLGSVTVLTSRGAGAETGTTSPYTRQAAIELEVPARSQRVHAGTHPELGGGGDAWCSPTSTAMLLGYLGDATDPRSDVVDAARATYDYSYRGTGNWAFNAAFAQSHGVDLYVSRLRDLRDVEPHLERERPVIASVTLNRKTMPEAGYDTEGHLLVIAGFSAEGDVIVYDPAAPTPEGARRTYPRGAFERAWLPASASAGIAYVCGDEGAGPAGITG